MSSKELKTGRFGQAAYRGWVGPTWDYDLIGGLQFTLLFYAGLREDHQFLDLGCGSLRGGRLFIPYLKPDKYYGVEPHERLVEEGIDHELGSDVLSVKRPTFSTIGDFSLDSLGVRFDFVLAHSILSHTFDDLALRALSGVSDCLAEEGVLIATFQEGDAPRSGSGWLTAKAVPYRWPEMQALGKRSGLSLRRLSWPHPRQVWFAGALGEARVEEVAERVSRTYPRL